VAVEVLLVTFSSPSFSVRQRQPTNYIFTLCGMHCIECGGGDCYRCSSVVGLYVCLSLCVSVREPGKTANNPDDVWGMTRVDARGYMVDGVNVDRIHSAPREPREATRWQTDGHRKRQRCSVCSNIRILCIACDAAE